MTTATEAPTALPGIWTPWATVVCYRCHGPSKKTARAITNDVILKNSEPRQGIPEGDFDWGETITDCDLCAKSIWVMGDAGLLGSLRPLLQKAAPSAHTELQQTGGMCAALDVYEDGKQSYPRVIVTCLDGPFFIARYESAAMYEEGMHSGELQTAPRDAQLSEVVTMTLAALESPPGVSEPLRAFEVEMRRVVYEYATVRVIARSEDQAILDADDKARFDDRIWSSEGCRDQIIEVQEVYETE